MIKAVIICCFRFINISDNVRSLSLPGTYHEKISGFGDSLKHFSRLKSLDVSRNAVESLSVNPMLPCFFYQLYFRTPVTTCKSDSHVYWALYSHDHRFPP